MTAKEKATELVQRFKFYQLPEDKRILIDNPKQCALLCVYEILEALEHHTWQNKDWIRYYKEVREEINICL